MDPLRNPYTPGAGTRPPALTGRDEELERFRLLIGRLQAGRHEKSMLITGLRGVGKTVLLNTFSDIARQGGWVPGF
jgi:Cdc6-like AAA superfamily ATPase